MRSMFVDKATKANQGDFLAAQDGDAGDAGCAVCAGVGGLWVVGS
jgi:hypothetical protein